MIQWETDKMETKEKKIISKTYIKEPLSKNRVEYLVTGEIIKATGVPSESLFYYLTMQVISDQKSCYQLVSEKSKEVLVSQYSKGKLCRRTPSHISACFVFPFNFKFIQILKFPPKNSDQKKIEAKENQSKEEDLLEKKTPVTDQDISEPNKETNTDNKPLNNDDSKEVLFPEDSLLNPLNALNPLKQTASKKRIGILVEVFSIDQNTVTNSVGFSKFYIDAIPQSVSLRLPLFIPKLGMWNRIKTALIGGLISIEQKENFIKDSNCENFSQQMLRKGWLWVDINVVSKSHATVKAAREKETDQKMREMFVKHKTKLQ